MENEKDTGQPSLTMWLQGTMGTEGVLLLHPSLPRHQASICHKTHLRKKGQNCGTIIFLPNVHLTFTRKRQMLGETLLRGFVLNGNFQGTL